MKTLPPRGSQRVPILCALVAFALGAPAQADAPRPNVVVILVDDLDVAALDKMLALDLMRHF